jgi:ferredoxin-NADP reductase
MAGYTIEFTGRSDCGQSIASFRFTRPEGYEFLPGQWFTLRLQTAEGPMAETFSHCSAPGDGFLELTTRLTATPFKRALGAMPVGQRVHMVGPGGHLALPLYADRVAFLVGGVGITPVLSILRDAHQNGHAFADALLIYGNRDESCAPYLTEFEAMADIGVRAVPVYERPNDDWQGERGFIDAQIVRRHLGEDDGRPFVITGPPVMVEAMERVLDELAVDQARRVIERFGSGK